MRVEPYASRISVIIRRGRDIKLILFPCVHREGTIGGQSKKAQEERSHRKPTLPAL